MPSDGVSERMARDHEALVEWLQDRFGDELRWVADFDSGPFRYRIHHVRPDLRTELTDQELDVIVHRTMAVFNRHHLRDVYTHLGPARALVVEHEDATAVHVYTGETTAVVIKLAPGASITVPGFAAEVHEVLG